MSVGRLALAAAAVLAGAGAAIAHDGTAHGAAARDARVPDARVADAKLPDANDADARAPDRPARAARSAGPPPLPFEIEARFDLIDEAGRRVTEADFAGRRWLAFFGYASCEGICSAALPRMAAALDLLGARGRGLTPVMISVDPDRDTPEALAASLPRWHPRLRGLTGDAAALAAARAAFGVAARKAATLADGSPVFAHGGYAYLVGPDGRVETILPPVLSAERMAEIIARYL